MSKSANARKPSKTASKSAVTGCFVSSASAAYRYYANNESARNKAVERFEDRVTTHGQDPMKPATANKKSRRSA